MRKGWEGTQDEERGERRLYVLGESGEGQRTEALPDRGDAKPGRASTCNQITVNVLPYTFSIFMDRNI